MRSCPCRQRLAAHQVSEVWAKLSLCRRAADRVAIDTGVREEHCATFWGVRVCRSGLLLLFDPSFKLILWVYNYANQHSRVLCAAVFSAVASIDSGFGGLDPHQVFAVRNEICFTGQLGYPKTMCDVGRLQLKKCRPRSMPVACRDM